MSRIPDQEVIIDIVRRVTTEICTTMMGMEVACGEAYSETQAQSGAEGVVSFIGLAGKYVGTGSLRCNSDSACKLASNFLATPYEIVNEEVLDTFGELTNMVIGNFKNQLEGIVGPLALSIPSVIHAHKFDIGSQGHEQWTVVPFSWDENKLEVKVCLKDVDSRRTGEGRERA